MHVFVDVFLGSIDRIGKALRFARKSNRLYETNEAKRKINELERIQESYTYSYSNNNNNNSEYPEIDPSFLDNNDNNDNNDINYPNIILNKFKNIWNIILNSIHNFINNIGFIPEWIKNFEITPQYRKPIYILLCITLILSIYRFIILKHPIGISTYNNNNTYNEYKYSKPKKSKSKPVIIISFHPYIPPSKTIYNIIITYIIII